MLTPQQIQDAAWNKFSADPDNAGVSKDAFLAAFATAPVTTPATTNNAPTEQDRRIADLEAQFSQREATFAAEQDQRDAKDFYGEMLMAGKTTPAEKDATLAAFENARFKDRHTLATFSANAEGSAEANLRAQFTAKPAAFRMGPPVLDSQATFSVNSPYGIYGDDLKTEGN